MPDNRLGAPRIKDDRDQVVHPSYGHADIRDNYPHVCIYRIVYTSCAVGSGLLYGISGRLGLLMVLWPEPEEERVPAWD